MGELTDKAKGAANSLTGKAKEAIGKESNDASLTAEGQAQQVKSGVQNAVGTVKGAFGDKI